MCSKYYPYTPDDAKSMKNPAIQLYGNRLFSDQTVSELLVEFLLVVFSPKRFGDAEIFEQPLPSRDLLALPPEKLEYAPRARLNLKLFSFLGASRLDSRHYTHRAHHEELLDKLEKRISMAGAGDKDDVVRTIENLFLGFQGAGSGRTWCAQSFLPVSPVFLAREAIWKESKANSAPPENDWLWFVENRYFDMSQHLFLARGGEVLFLQLCNALRQPANRIAEWCAAEDLGLSSQEQDPAWLHAELFQALGQLMDYCPRTLTDLADFVDSGLEGDTSNQTDGADEERRFVGAGWCNADSWREGYLFGVELLRLMKTNLDVVDRIYLLESACAMQVLRTLAMQSVRVVGGNETHFDGLGYRLVVSSPEDDRPAIRRLSQHSVKAVEKIIFKSLRGPEVDLPADVTELNKILRQADRAYGGKLFVGLSKRIGFMVPKRGSGARFVINEHLLRFLVLTTVPLGGRLTFDTFKDLLEKRHGLVFDAGGLDRASHWLNGTGIYLSADTDKWLQEMLEAADFLIHLSDSCALVHNPADAGKDVQ
jgi:hypothetical protein